MNALNSDFKIPGVLSGVHPRSAKWRSSKPEGTSSSNSGAAIDAAEEPSRGEMGFEVLMDWKHRTGGGSLLYL